jgi:hypothetical protein
MLRLNDGRSRYFQNWDRDRDLLFNGHAHKYLNFPIPPLKRSIGEDAGTISLTLPNVGSAEFGYLPLREWAQQDFIENALLQFWIFIGDNILATYSFSVAERVFSQRVIELRLRQPDDGFARALTAVYDYNLIGETPNYSAF